MQRSDSFFIVCMAFGLIALSSPLARAETPANNAQQNPFAGNAEAIAVGKVTFEAVCAGYCHATETTKRPGQCPNLFDCEWKHGKSDGEVFHTLTEGVPKTQMVGFKGKLPDETLWKIIAYLRSASRCKDGKPAEVAH